MLLNRVGLKAGATAFNSRYFHKAHEIWEDIWNDSVGDEKHFVGGLVQLAAGYLKFSIGQQNGARKLLKSGCGVLSSSGDVDSGLNLSSLIDFSEALFRSMERGGKPDEIEYPKILKV